MFCIRCGKELKSDWKICPNCGFPVNDQQAKNKISGNVQKSISRSLYKKWWFWVSVFIVMVLGLSAMILISSYSISEDPSSEKQDIEIAEDVDEISDITDAPLENNLGEVNLTDQEAENEVVEAQESEDVTEEIQEIEDEVAETFDDITEYPSDEGSDFPVWSKEYLFWYTQGLRDSYVDAYIKIAKNLLEKTDQLDANIHMRTEGGLFEKEHFEMTRDNSMYLYAGEIKDNKPEGLGILSKRYQLEQERYNEYGEYETVPLYLPIYIGEFSEGRYNGTGMSYEDRSESISITDVKVENVEDIDLLEYSEQYFLSISYIGNFSNGEKSGDGVLFSYPSPSSSAYGSWDEIEDIYHLDLSNISVTLGQFKDDELNGEGKIYEDQQLLYEGGFADDDLCGVGIQYFPNSTKIQYKGEFKRGQYNGTGTLYDEDGNIVYEGKWNFGDYTD